MQNLEPAEQFMAWPLTARSVECNIATDFGMEEQAGESNCYTCPEPVADCIACLRCLGIYYTYAW